MLTQKKKLLFNLASTLRLPKIHQKGQFQPKKKSAVFKKTLTKINNQFHSNSQFSLSHQNNPNFNSQNKLTQHDHKENLQSSFIHSKLTTKNVQSYLQNSSFKIQQNLQFQKNLRNSVESLKSSNNFLLSLFDQNISNNHRKQSKKLQEEQIYELNNNSSFLNNQQFNDTLEKSSFDDRKNKVKFERQDIRQKCMSSSLNLKFLNKGTKTSQQSIEKHGFSTNFEIKRTKFYSNPSKFYSQQNSLIPNDLQANQNSKQDSRLTINNNTRSLSLNLSKKKIQQQKKKKQEHFNRIRELINCCRKVQNEKKVKKQMVVFSDYSRKFSKECEKKRKKFQKIKKMDQ